MHDQLTPDYARMVAGGKVAGPLFWFGLPVAYRRSAFSDDGLASRRQSAATGQRSIGEGRYERRLGHGGIGGRLKIGLTDGILYSWAEQGMTTCSPDCPP